MSKRSILIIISVAALTMLGTVSASRDKAADKMVSNLRNMYRRPSDIRKVVEYYYRQDKYWYPLVINALFILMKEFGHTADVMQCIPVYELTLLTYNNKLPKRHREYLDTAQTALVNDFIIPSGAKGLEVMHTSNVSKLLDWIKKDNRGFEVQILPRYWDNLRWKSQNPVQDYAATTNEVRQNIYLVLFLYKMHKENGKFDNELLRQMKKMTGLPDYEATVSRNVKREVAELVKNLGPGPEPPKNETITSTTKRPITGGGNELVLPESDKNLIDKMRGIYQNGASFDFHKAVDYIDSIYESESRVAHLIALFHVMHQLNHTNDVITAIPLHDALVNRLEEDGTQIQLPVMMNLERLKEWLIDIVISPQSMIELVNQVSKLRLTKILDLVYNTTDTLAEHIIGQYWDIISQNINVDSVQRASRVSPYVRQNVFMLLMLYRMNKFTDKKLGKLHEVLKFIMLNPDYKATVSNEHRRQVEKIYTLTANYEILINVIKIYANNFDNYGKVVDYMDDAHGTERKAYIVISLYEVMKTAKHLNELFRALELYKTVEERANTRPHQLKADQLKKLNEIREELLQVILDGGYRILDNAVKSGKVSPIAIKLLEALNILGNRTILNETLGKVWGELVNTTKDPLQKILKIVETQQQKVELLLALLGLDNLSQSHMISIIDELAKIKNSPDYDKLPDDIKAQVDRAITQIWFMRKVVSIFQQGGGKVRYLQQCSDTDEQACVSKSKNLRRLFLPYTTNESKMKLGVPHFRNHLCLRKGISATSGKTFNVFTRSTSRDDYYWYAHVNQDDNTVIFSDEKKEQYLCADENETKAFTRKKQSFEAHKDECKWTVEVWF